MTSEVVAVESVPVELTLASEQVNVLRSLGRELAAKAAWWGSQSSETSRSVVDVSLLGENRYSVKFRDVIGAVRIGALHVRIVPKIPDAHFRYVVSRSSVVPRSADRAVALDAGRDYKNLLAHWLVGEAEIVVRRGLRVGYSEEADELPMVRGRIDVLETAIANQQGRPVARCHFECLTEDTALNRVVKAACQLVAAGAGYASVLRKRAIRVVSRMDGVGRLLPADRHVRVCRLTMAYARVLPLARLVLEYGGVSTRVGACEGRAFLLRTPELIEDGIRQIIAEGVGGFSVRKRRLFLGSSGVSLNPDLVFESGLAVGDVKYKFLRRDWDTSSLYQVIAFSAGFCARHCAILGFAAVGGTGLPPNVTIGGISARSFAWIASTQSAPEESERLLLDEVRNWLLRAGRQDSSQPMSS